MFAALPGLSDIEQLKARIKEWPENVFYIECYYGNDGSDDSLEVQVTFRHTSCTDSVNCSIEEAAELIELSTLYVYELAVRSLENHSTEIGKRFSRKFQIPELINFVPKRDGNKPEIIDLDHMR